MMGGAVKGESNARPSAARGAWMATLVARLAAPLLIGLGLFALAAPASAGSATAGSLTAGSATAGSGWLRLAHLSPNTPAVDVYLYSFHNSNALIVVHHVAYGTISGYTKVPSGEYTVAMRAAGAPPSTAPVISTNVNVLPGAAYTVAGLGPANGLRLQVLRDRLITPRGKALVRIIQASLIEHTVTVTVGGKAVVSQLSFASVTSYHAVSPGTSVVRAAGRTEHVQATISLAAGTIHTIVVLDDPGSLRLDDLVDAVGSGVVPAGAPATGFGGAAPRPSPSKVPWLVLVGGGLLLGSAGAGWYARPRGAHARRRRRPRAAT